MRPNEVVKFPKKMVPDKMVVNLKLLDPLMKTSLWVIEHHSSPIVTTQKQWWMRLKYTPYRS